MCIYGVTDLRLSSALYPKIPNPHHPLQLDLAQQLYSEILTHDTQFPHSIKFLLSGDLFIYLLFFFV